MPKSGQKNVNYVKTKLSYGPRKLIGCSFVRFFMKKPFFSCPFFVKLFMKNPILSCPYLVQKNVNSLNTTLYYGSKQSLGCPFFFRFFTKKSLLSCPYFVKKLPFFKKHSALIPIHYQKNVNSLKNTMLSCHFFSKKIEKDHHTIGIELVFSFVYPS